MKILARYLRFSSLSQAHLITEDLIHGLWQHDEIDKGLLN